jgi:hypothetical protein
MDQFTHQFKFEFGVTKRGEPHPYVIGIDGGQVIFRLSDREEVFGEETSTFEKVLNS